jgi:hypothetical protein
MGVKSSTLGRSLVQRFIFGKGKKISNLEKNLDFLKEKYKELFDDELYQKAKSLLEIIK